jgi:hypothetical protein
VESDGLEKTREKRGMHSTQYIQPVTTSMTEPEPSVEQEEFLMEGDEYLAGGIELHAQIVEEGGRP